jgi:chemotaxis protein methyltransferase CheR
MVLHQHGLLSRTTVLGTDLSQSALERARAGRYRGWSLRGVEADALAPYLESRAGEHRIRPELRERVLFKYLNLAEPSYPSPFDGTSEVDLIFCRNVFIYLSAPVILAIAQRLFEALAPGGYLVTGPSDPMLLDARFELLTTPGGIVYRRPLSVQVEPAPIRSEPEPAPPAAASRTHTRAARARRRTPDAIPSPVLPFDEAAALAEIRTIANRSGAVAAELKCREAIEASPLSVELHYAMGLLLLELDDFDGAVGAMRRVLYLDGSLAIAHYTLGRLLTRAGDRDGAERAYRNAERFACEREGHEELPLSEGLSAQGLAQAARQELSRYATAKGTG